MGAPSDRTRRTSPRRLKSGQPCQKCHLASACVALPRCRRERTRPLPCPQRPEPCPACARTSSSTRACRQPARGRPRAKLPEESAANMPSLKKSMPNGAPPSQALLASGVLAAIPAADEILAPEPRDPPSKPRLMTTRGDRRRRYTCRTGRRTSPKRKSRTTTPATYPRSLSSTARTEPRAPRRRSSRRAPGTAPARACSRYKLQPGRLPPTPFAEEGAKGPGRSSPGL
mmetsp:Transcript_53792/g.116266  ORF Transcript_53792/g.116266 Transcript_53792/m.116266 type:complete len:229 (-) Transcript_53792:73-759(-)